MWLTADHFTAVFWIAVIPAFMAAGLIIFAVHEPDDHRSRVSKARSPLSRAQLWRLGAEYWWVVAVATVFPLARFSEAFLVLRAPGAGLPIMLVPLVLVVMPVVYAGAAHLLGGWWDGIAPARVG